MEHFPVLCREIIEFFKTTPRPQISSYLDATFGRGGHLRAVLDEFPNIRAVAVDRDEQALASGRENFIQSNVTFVKSNFADIGALNLGLFDLILVDLGVSSPQLDQGHRGFSFYHQGPLDMRMDQAQEITAADVVNEFSEGELIEVFRTLGEVYRPERVVRAIVNDRKKKAFTETQELASLIERVEGWRKTGHHPATLFFMALRMQVNQELQSIERGIPALISSLNPGGRLAILTFHSIEDRLVKQILKSPAHENDGLMITKKVVKPTFAETKENSRSRSAKLRVFERTSAHEKVSD